MSILDEPMILLHHTSPSHAYVMAFDPRDLSAVFFRAGLVFGRGTVTSHDSLPVSTRDYFDRESHRLAEEWCAAHPNYAESP